MTSPDSRMWKAPAVIIAVVVGCAVAWRIAYPTYTHNFRLTLEVDTPAGLKAGARVFEVRTTTYPSIVTLGNNSQETRVRGEGVFVDLGDGRHVFAAMAHGALAQHTDFNLTFMTFAQNGHIGGRTLAPRESAEFLSAKKGTVELHGDLIPTLMTFDDLHNHRSARAVAPENFTARFGMGYQLRRVWIEMTTDPVMRHIGTSLPFLAALEAAEKGSCLSKPTMLRTCAWVFRRQ